jgi:hypothetical protein
MVVAGKPSPPNKTTKEGYMMREVRFKTIDEFDAWVKDAAIKLRVPAKTMELWANIKKAVKHLYNAAQWGLDAHPSHCQYDIIVVNDALRPYECEDEQGD